jgi:hypothetical protein
MQCTCISKRCTYIIGATVAGVTAARGRGKSLKINCQRVVVFLRPLVITLTSPTEPLVTIYDTFYTNNMSTTAANAVLFLHPIAPSPAAATVARAVTIKTTIHRPVL